jgi:hypothetical protein
MRPLRALVLLVVIVAAAACGGDPAPSAGSLPASDHVHALRAADDGSLLLGLHGALWRSEDGATWEQLGLEGQDAMALGVAAEGQPLLIGGHDVLARSTDGGESFEMLSPQLPSLDIHALAQAPSDPSIVYAYVVGAGIYRSTDAGDTWAPAAAVGEQLPGDLAAMAVDPNDPQVVLVGSGGNGVFRSVDGATSFSQTTDWGTLGLGFAADGTVLAATYRGVDVSNDSGQTWDNAAPAEEFDGQPIAVAIGPDGTRWVMTEEPRVLYRDTGDGFGEVARA